MSSSGAQPLLEKFLEEKGIDLDEEVLDNYEEGRLEVDTTGEHIKLVDPDGVIPDHYYRDEYTLRTVLENPDPGNYSFVEYKSNPQELEIYDRTNPDSWVRSDNFVVPPP